MKHNPLHSYEEIAEVLEYAAIAGGSSLVWKKDVSARAKKGQPAGCACRNTKYWVVRFEGRRYYAHRIVWLLNNKQWPSLELDHIDSDRNNNTLPNLRESTHSQNCHNRKDKRVGISGFKGVSWDGKNNKWRATIGVDGKKKRLGLFDDPSEAHKAYVKAKEHYAPSHL